MHQVLALRGPARPAASDPGISEAA
jgi:hypothetical protein